MEKNNEISDFTDSNITSISQRKPNQIFNHRTIMPQLPIINLINTKWQDDTINSRLTSDPCKNRMSTSDKQLMPPPKLPEKAEAVSKNNEIVIKFNNWTPYINSKLKIAVKGLVKNTWQHGRSIKERISNVHLKDSQNFTYILEGSCTDGELPEYIQKKFQNGFPQDWQVVSAVWIDYIKQSKPATFRWPQQISDSNEDFHETHEFTDESKSSESIISIPDVGNEQNNTNMAMENVIEPRNECHRSTTQHNQIKIISDIQLVKPNAVPEINNETLKRPQNYRENKETKRKRLKTLLLGMIDKILEFISDDELTTSVGVQTTNQECNTTAQNNNTTPLTALNKDTINENTNTINGNLSKDRESSPECMGIPLISGTTPQEHSRTRQTISYRDYKRQKKSKAGNKSTNHTRKSVQNISEINENLNPETNYCNNPVTEDKNLDESVVSYSTNMIKSVKNDTVILNNVHKDRDSEYSNFSEALKNQLAKQKHSHKCIEKNTVLPQRSTPNAQNEQSKSIESSKPTTNTIGSNLKAINNVSDESTLSDSFLSDDETSKRSRGTIILRSKSTISDLTQRTKNQVKENENKGSEGTPLMKSVLEKNLQVSRRGRIISKPLQFWKGENLSKVITNVDADKIQPDVSDETLNRRNISKTGKRKLWSENREPLEEDELHAQLRVVSKKVNRTPSEISYFTNLE